jgi:lysophospholipase L1-like esterase/GNAT superfamily N-acetyltransferase
MRICFFGDSFVNGTGDDDGLGWVGRVVSRARRGGRDLTAYNLGIRGNTSADVAARWEAEAKLRLLPEHDGRLVFSFGANDCASKVDGGPRVARAVSLAHAEAILEAAHRWLPTLMVGPSIIAGDQEANARIAALSADYANLCERIGVPYLEICRVLAASPTWLREALAGDGAHPNREGYSIVADAVSGWSSWRRWVETSRVIAADPSSVLPERIESLLRRVYVDAGFTDPKIAATSFAASAVFARGQLLVTRDDLTGALTGMVIVAGPDSPARKIATDGEVEMHLLAVVPEHRKAGIGRALVDAAIDFAREKKFGKMVLWTQPAMNDAHRLYERFGFVRTPGRDFENAGRPFWVFEKNL